MGTRVMLVEDHQLMREVLERLVAGEHDLEVVRAVPDAAQAMRLVDDLHPDVILMDIDLPDTDGISATRSLVGRDPSLRVVILSASCTPTLVRDAVAAGACGYLVKGDPPHRIFAGIRAAARGQHPMTPQAVASWA
jgi:DNA-binding NarL/FixJ family response regulator